MKITLDSQRPHGGGKWKQKARLGKHRQDLRCLNALLYTGRGKAQRFEQKIALFLLCFVLEPELLLMGRQEGGMCLIPGDDSS